MDKEKIEEFITKYPDWYQEGDALVAGFEFKDFSTVSSTVQEILAIAAALDHHPTVTFGYNTIEISTCTHEAKNTITEKDFALAEQISTHISG